MRLFSELHKFVTATVTITPTTARWVTLEISCEQSPADMRIHFFVEKHLTGRCSFSFFHREISNRTPLAHSTRTALHCIALHCNRNAIEELIRKQLFAYQLCNESRSNSKSNTHTPLSLLSFRCPFGKIARTLSHFIDGVLNPTLVVTLVTLWESQLPQNNWPFLEFLMISFCPTNFRQEMIRNRT